MTPEGVVAILVGVGALLTACCTSMHKSRCTEIDCDCLHIERSIEEEFTHEQINQM